jgi:transcriptional regulator with XRE-family HTH domain
MSRPRGSEAISLDDLQAAADRIRSRIGRAAELTQLALATEAGVSESGLRAWHRRRRLSWQEFRTSLDRLAVVCRLTPPCHRDDDAMRALLVPLEPDIAERLRELARAEHRHPRDEAALILADAIRRRQRRPAARDLAPVA